jgi:hypothetical protein
MDKPNEVVTANFVRALYYSSKKNPICSVFLAAALKNAKIPKQIIQQTFSFEEKV